MPLGESIRKRRIALGISQQALADALGYHSRSTIAKIEKNSSRLSQDKLITLAHVLHTTVENLVYGKEPSAVEKTSAAFVSETDLDRVGSGPKDKRKVAAVILAGGRKRVNKYSIPIQFASVKGVPIIIHTMELFQRHPLVDEIHVVSLAGWEDFFPPYVEKYGITKFREIIPAGNSGIQSVKNAVEWLAATHSPFDILLIHEATRPFSDPETISNAVLCCKQFGNAVTYERMDELTPFLLDDESGALTHLEASRLINVQSPEVYTLGMLRQAFFDAAARRISLNETICAVFLHNLGRQLKFCEGGHNNYRIVREEDIRLLETLL